MKTLISLFILACYAFSLNLQGSGATSVNSVIKALSEAYFKHSEIEVQYTSIGSSGGIKQVKRDEVDFALTEIRKEKPDDVFQEIPFLNGNIVVVFNLEGIKNLNLTPKIIAKIYLGDVVYWDDEEIVNLNPNVPLKHIKITPIHRYDGSGTTLIFSTFLSSYSEKWRNLIGSSRAPQWSVGIGRRGNEGVAKEVKHTAFSLGYVEYSYAKEHDLATVLIKINNALYKVNSNEYSLKTRSYFFFKKDGKNAKDVRRFIDFIYRNGDKIIKDAGLEPLKEIDKERISIN